MLIMYTYYEVWNVVVIYCLAAPMRGQDKAVWLSLSCRALRGQD